MSEPPHEAEKKLEELKKPLLTAKELAAKLSVSEKTIYSYVSQDLVPYVKIESNVRFSPDAINNWLRAKLATPSATKGLRRAFNARKSGSSKSGVVTARDVEVLRAFTTRRYLGTSQLQRLFFPSIRTANRRLNFLLRQGLLAQFSLPMRPGQGASEYVYYLRPAGFEILSIDPPAYALSNPKPSRTSGPKSLAYIAHFLEVSDFWISLLQACSESEVKLVQFGGSDPDSDLCEGIEESAGVRPDSFFILSNKEGKQALFFLEVDRGTEKISSKDYYSFQKKVGSYLNFYQKSMFRRFGEFTGFRVLVIAPTKLRFENLRKAVADMGVKRLFWFCLRKDIFEENVLTIPFWLLPDGQEVFSLVKDDRNQTSATQRQVLDEGHSP